MKEIKDYAELDILDKVEGAEVRVSSTDLVYRVIRGRWVLVARWKDGKYEELR